MIETSSGFPVPERSHGGVGGLLGGIVLFDAPIARGCLAGGCAFGGLKFSRFGDDHSASIC